MKYNVLGNTDLKVSSICLGTMTWGVQNTEDEGHEQMDFALSQGVNFFDTAEMYAIPPTEETYGKTEEIIGTWFAKRKNRDQVILATKVAGPGLPWVREGKARIDRDNITMAVEGSLKRLQTDYIDLYQFHWPNRSHYHFGRHWDFRPWETDPDEDNDLFVEGLETCAELIKQGKIRHVGLSNETAWGTMRYVQLAKEKNLPKVVSIQNEYSLTCRIFEPDLSEVAMHEKVGLLAYSPLVAGAISGKYLNGQMPKGSRRSLLSAPPHRDTPTTNEAISAYIEIANTYDLDVCQMALAFVNSKPFVTSNIIGATTMNQLKMNINSINISLGESVLNDIDKIFKKYPLPY
jgi:aryl-alcohol dehydrogenase-like predicted oxidoreductase